MIVVDTREPWEEMLEKLDEYGAGNAKVATLNANHDHPKADFVIGDDRQFGIQRKTVNDFVGSLDTLKDDLHKLREGHELSALLVEGNWKTAGPQIAVRRGKTMNKSMGVTALHNFILSQQLRGTVFIHTNSTSETCRVLVGIEDYLGGYPSPPTDDYSDPATMLVAVPGVGTATAARLVDEYGGAYQAICRVEDWTEVKGIGESTLDDILDWMERGSNE